MTAPVRDGGPVLSVRLLGDFELRAAGAAAAALESSRAESLLAYLLLHRDAHQPRPRIAGALWPESTESRARTNLRHATPELDACLAVTPRTLHWSPPGAWWLDMAAFDASVARADRAADDGGAAAELRAAVEVYRGDLLPGCYDEWLDGERQLLRDRFLAALQRLAMLLDRGGDPAGAICRRLWRRMRLQPGFACRRRSHATTRFHR